MLSASCRIARTRSAVPSASRWLLISSPYSTPAAEGSLDTLIRSALKEAMKARDKPKSLLFKSVLAELQNASHLPSPPPPTKTLARAITAREEGAVLYGSSNPPRADLVEQYNWEAGVLKDFMPPEAEGMNDSDLLALVHTALEELGLPQDVAVGKNLGRVIKAVTEKAAGKALGKQVAEAVKRIGTSS